MASFSYQHRPILLDSVFMANNNSGTAKNMSGLSLDHQIHEGDMCYSNINNNSNNNSTTFFSQFHHPFIMSDQLAQSSVHGIPISSDQIYSISSSKNDNNNNFSQSSDENELSSVTKKQSTESSTVVDKLDQSSGDDEQVTQKLPLPMEKKRKSSNFASTSNSSQSKEARESGRGKKQKSGKRNGSMKDNDDINNKEENKVKLNNGKNGEAKNNKSQEEPPSGYIHVRARRGQATDSHSLAERVRREKISERMKMLQRLVPGCEKVTGKALMLDEIINYVQSLQNQVEFLSMKLASLNPMFYDFGMDIDAFLMRPEGLNTTLGSQIPSVPQCSQSQPTAFTTQNNSNNYQTLLDNSANSILAQQAQRPNMTLSHENVSLLWDMEDQRQSFLNPSGFSNLCSFN